MPKKTIYKSSKKGHGVCYPRMLPDGMMLPPKGLIFSDFYSPLNVYPEKPAKAYPLYSNFGTYAL